WGGLPPRRGTSAWSRGRGFQARRCVESNLAEAARPCARAGELAHALVGLKHRAGDGHRLLGERGARDLGALRRSTDLGGGAPGGVDEREGRARVEELVLERHGLAIGL